MLSPKENDVTNKPSLYEGRIVALTSLPATNDHGERRELSGLFTLVEFWPVEPSAYVHAPTWIVAEAERTDGPTWDVDADLLFEQVDPVAYGHNLAADRLADLQMEDAMAEWDDEAAFGDLTYS